VLYFKKDFKKVLFLFVFNLLYCVIVNGDNNFYPTLWGVTPLCVSHHFICEKTKEQIFTKNVMIIFEFCQIKK